MRALERFSGLAYFDFYYTLVAVVVLCKVSLTAKQEVGQVNLGATQGESTPRGAVT